MKELLKELNACREAVEWAGDKTWEEIYNTCHRGDWLLWLLKRTMEDNEVNLRLLTLVKGHCANTVRHLMNDERSVKAVDTAIRFGEGKATREELDAVYYDAYDAYDAAYTAVAAAYTAVAAACAAVAATYTAVAAAYAADAADAADARTKNQMETADICRKYLPKEVWNIKNKNV
jgi:hypothetical protein